MPSLSVLKVLLRELATSERAARIPEPELIMDSPEQVAAYAATGREGGSLAPLYLFHTSQISEVIRPGDTVVDLACGPANQLAQVARLNPETRFIGIDLSPGMLDQAAELIAEQGLTNIETRLGDITDAGFIADRSVDAVISTLSLHHLPDVHALRAAFREAARILKPDGGVYFADLGHLKSERSIQYFANQYADRQPAIFTLDYLNSLRAAFALEELRGAASALGTRAKVFSTFLVPYMVVVKTGPRRDRDEVLRESLRRCKASLAEYHRRDLNDLRQFFRWGGVASPYLD